MALTEYACRVPGCPWSRPEPPPNSGPQIYQAIAEQYDLHESEAHPGSKQSGITTRVVHPDRGDQP